MYLVLHQSLGIPSYIASPVIVFIVMSISYVLNAKFVFLNDLDIKQYIEFMVLTGIGVITIQTTISYVFETRAQNFLSSIDISRDNNINIFLANSLVRICGVIFSILWNYLFYKHIVFRVKIKPPKEEVATD